MASYIQGITDYIPQVQPFHPDLGFFANVLSGKEQQYHQGYQKLSGIYGSLLNSPMLRQSDIQTRDNFFKKATEQVQKISEQDLSLQDNVNQAMQVFQPLIEDNNILSDMALTKQYHGEMSHAESLRNCVPSKDNPCTGYWNEGVQDLNNWAQDYSQTDDKDALQFSRPRYVPYVNPQELAMTHIKGMGFKTSGVSFMSAGKDQKYIVTTSNGTRMIAPLSDYLLGVVGSDPRVQDVYGVKARLLMRNQVDNLLPQFKGDRAAAEDFYLNQAQGQLNQYQNAFKGKLDKHTNELDSSIKTLGSNIPPGGVKSDNPLMITLSDLLHQKQGLAQAAQNGPTLDQKTLLSATRLSQRSQISSALAHSLMYGDLNKVAIDYAMMTASSKIEADPYSKLNYEDNLKRTDMLFEYQLKSTLQREKIGAQPKGTNPDDFFHPMTTRESEQGNFGTVDLLKQQSETFGMYKGPADASVNGVASQVYKQLATKVDYAQDQAKGQDALNQLNNIFGAAAINELRAKGKLSDNNITDSKLYKPATSYHNIQNHWNDSLFRQNYNDIISSTGVAKGIADTQFSAVNSLAETISDNHKAVINAIYADPNLSNQEKSLTSSMIQDGDLMSKEQYMEHMKGVLPPQSASSFYDKYSKKYTEIFNAHPDLVKPLTNPFNNTGTNGVGSRTMGGLVKTRNSGNAAVQVAEQLRNSLDVNQPFGISTDISPNSKSRVFLPGTPEYIDRENVIRQYLKDMGQDLNKKSTMTRTTDDAVISASPTSFSGEKQAVTLSPTRDWFKQFNENYKGSESGKVNGLKYEDFQHISVIFDKNNSPGQIFDRFKYGPTDIALMQGKTVTINAFPDVGTVSLNRNSEGGVNVHVDYKVIGPDGKMQSINYNAVAENGDLAYNKYLNELAAAHQLNSALISKSPEFQGPIKDLNQATQLLMGDEPDQSDE